MILREGVIVVKEKGTRECNKSCEAKGEAVCEWN
jgi:hypothetical protein